MARPPASPWFSLEGRVATFASGGWPHGRSTPPYCATPESLAHAGFYCRPVEGSTDNVCCFVCDKNLDGWEACDEAWSEHVKHAPNCPFVKMDVQSNRALSFASNPLWPHARCKALSPTTGGAAYDDDTSVCFQCGLALDGWEEEDVPWEEHAKRRPECPFIMGRVAIRPCSFEFILAMKPDLNAVTHISASQQGAGPRPPSRAKEEGEGGAFKVPTAPAARKGRGAEAPRKSSMYRAEEPATGNWAEPSLARASGRKSSIATKRGEAHPDVQSRTSLKAATATAAAAHDEGPLSGLLGSLLMSTSYLDLSVREALLKRSSEMMDRFEKAAAALLMSFDEQCILASRPDTGRAAPKGAAGPSSSRVA